MMDTLILDKREAGGSPETVNFALMDRITGVPPEMDDSESRLSELETTGCKPVVRDRQDAYPPAKLTALGGRLMAWNQDMRKSLLMISMAVLPMVLHATAAEAPRNLVPSEPGKSPNYWCTWSAQSYMQGQDAKANDPILYQVASIDKYAALQLNEEYLFGANGWLKNFYPKVRGDLWVVLDDGWDLPVNRDLGYRNFSKLDPEKFPSFKGSIPENLVTLNKKVKECGWRGVGLWYRAYEPAIDAERKKTFSSEAEYKKVFWCERLEWSKAAGIGYWKMDGGDEAAWRMMTDFADPFFPGLVMEHGNPSKDGPFNSYPGNGRVDPAYVDAGKRVIQYSEVMRLHDHSPQLGIPTMLERTTSMLDAVKTKPAKTGYLNCEDEVTIAAVLGGTMGVMRSPMVGLRPGDDPDIFLKGPRNLKKLMDEVVRAVRWQRIAPAFGAGVMETQVDHKLLLDSYKFPAGEFWTSTEDWTTTYASPYACMNKVVAQQAPARVARGLPLPEVTCEGEPPYVLAALHPTRAGHHLMADEWVRTVTEFFK